MKLVLLIVVSCLVLHNGKGAPRKTMYKFVRCNPSGDQANCVTHQTPEMPWSPDLPAKLPASSAQSLEAKPVEDESPLREDNTEEEEEEEEDKVDEEEDDERWEEMEEEEEEDQVDEEEDDQGWEEREEEEEEEEEEEMEEEEEEEWENEEDEETPVISEEGETPPHLFKEGSGFYEASADAFVTLADIGSGESWTEEGTDVVGESQPSESQAKPAEQELREDNLLSP